MNIFALKILCPAHSHFEKVFHCKSDTFCAYYRVVTLLLHMNVSCCYAAVHVAIEEGDPEEAVAEEEVSEGPGKTCSYHYNLDEFQASSCTEAPLSLLQITS